MMGGLLCLKNVCHCQVISIIAVGTCWELPCCESLTIKGHRYWCLKVFQTQNHLRQVHYFRFASTQTVFRDLTKTVELATLHIWCACACASGLPVCVGMASMRPCPTPVFSSDLRLVALIPDPVRYANSCVQMSSTSLGKPVWTCS